METFIKNERLRPILFFLSGLLLATIFFVLSNLLEHDTGMGLKIGTIFPEFSYPDLSGTMVSSKEYKGKNMLLMFADPGSDICKKFLPIVRDFTEKHKGRVNLVIISSGTDSSNKALAAEYRLGVPVLKTEIEFSKQRYKIRGVPSLYLVDRGGVIRGKHGGWSLDIERDLRKMLKKVS